MNDFLIIPHPIFREEEEPKELHRTEPSVHDLWISNYNLSLNSQGEFLVFVHCSCAEMSRSYKIFKLSFWSVAWRSVVAF